MSVADTLISIRLLLSERLARTPTRADNQRLSVAIYELHNVMPNNPELFNLWQGLSSTKKDPVRFEQAVLRLNSFLQTSSITGGAPAMRSAAAFYNQGVSNRDDATRAATPLPHSAPVSTPSQLPVSNGPPSSITVERLSSAPIYGSPQAGQFPNQSNEYHSYQVPATPQSVPVAPIPYHASQSEFTVAAATPPSNPEELSNEPPPPGYTFAAEVGPPPSPAPPPPPPPIVVPAQPESAPVVSEKGRMPQSWENPPQPTAGQSSSAHIAGGSGSSPMYQSHSQSTSSSQAALNGQPEQQYPASQHTQNLPAEAAYPSYTPVYQQTQSSYTQTNSASAYTHQEVLPLFPPQEQQLAQGHGPSRTSSHAPSASTSSIPAYTLEDRETSSTSPSPSQFTPGSAAASMPLYPMNTGGNYVESAQAQAWRPAHAASPSIPAYSVENMSASSTPASPPHAQSSGAWNAPQYASPDVHSGRTQQSPPPSSVTNAPRSSAYGDIPSFPPSSDAPSPHNVYPSPNSTPLSGRAASIPPSSPSDSTLSSPAPETPTYIASPQSASSGQFTWNETSNGALALQHPQQSPSQVRYPGEDLPRAQWRAPQYHPGTAPPLVKPTSSVAPAPAQIQAQAHRMSFIQPGPPPPLPSRAVSGSTAAYPSPQPSPASAPPILPYRAQVGPPPSSKSPSPGATSAVNTNSVRPSMHHANTVPPPPSHPSIPHAHHGVANVYRPVDPAPGTEPAPAPTTSPRPASGIYGGRVGPSGGRPLGGRPPSVSAPPAATLAPTSPSPASFYSSALPGGGAPKSYTPPQYHHSSQGSTSESQSRPLAHHAHTAPPPPSHPAQPHAHHGVATVYKPIEQPQLQQPSFPSDVPAQQQPQQQIPAQAQIQQQQPTPLAQPQPQYQPTQYQPNGSQSPPPPAPPLKQVAEQHTRGAAQFYYQATQAQAQAPYQQPQGPASPPAPAPVSPSPSAHSQSQSQYFTQAHAQAQPQVAPIQAQPQTGYTPTLFAGVPQAAGGGASPYQRPQYHPGNAPGGAQPQPQVQVQPQAQAPVQQAQVQQQPIAPNSTGSPVAYTPTAYNPYGTRQPASVPAPAPAPAVAPAAARPVAGRPQSYMAPSGSNPQAVQKPFSQAFGTLANMAGNALNRRVQKFANRPQSGMNQNQAQAQSSAVPPRPTSGVPAQPYHAQQQQQQPAANQNQDPNQPSTMHNLTTIASGVHKIYEHFDQSGGGSGANAFQGGGGSSPGTGVPDTSALLSQYTDPSGGGDTSSYDPSQIFNYTDPNTFDMSSLTQSLDFGGVTDTFTSTVSQFTDGSGVFDVVNTMFSATQNTDATQGAWDGMANAFINADTMSSAFDTMSAGNF